MTQRIQVDTAVPCDWVPTVSGEAELELSMVAAGSAPALRMDFDFKGGGGFVVARRPLARSMPKEYAVSFRVRGRGPALNHLELKLIDTSGLNVWRHVEKNLRLATHWKRVKIDSRDIDFAWGPSSGSPISTLGFVEFAIVAGEGGSGTLWIGDVTIEDCTPIRAPTVNASSELPGFEAGKALGSGWKPSLDDPRPWITIDSIRGRSFGGLTIDWLERAPSRGFRVRGSATGRRWKTLHSAARAGGKRTQVYLPDLDSRFIRLELNEPSAGAILHLRSFEFSRSIEAFWYQIAAAEERGWHPRWVHREQSLWTPIGTSHGSQCALMNDDGMVEVAEGSASVEPMLWIDGNLYTWASVTSRQELLEGWIPVPSVIWATADWQLSIQGEATTAGVVRIRYRLQNLAGRTLDARLFVLVRPFQVTPPWQSFRGLGGVSRIHDMDWREGVVRIDEASLIVPLTEPTGFGTLCFDDGFIGAHLAGGGLPEHPSVHDAFGFASGALAFDLSLRPQEAIERGVSCWAPEHVTTLPEAMDAARAPAFDWGARLPVAQWRGNGWATDAIRAALTATAHILVTRSGAALQPGPRRYTRSWIRDGAMMSAALLRMGHVDEVGQFIRWYAPRQREDGFVPCCVDRDGVDWLVEHDSHGELLALIADYYRFTGDESFLAEWWPAVDKAVGCIERLLGAEGLLPISVSHEGYLAQPVHSYWDDFWALRGLRDATDLARADDGSSADHWERLAMNLAASLYASIEKTRTRSGLDFIPGSVEWADFDPTATANALYLHDIPAALDRAAVDRTFDKYLADWRGKRSGAVVWQNYTPYEIRIIGAFVRLGERDEALELLRFFLSDRRPGPWNQWPEIAWRDRQAPAHLGDLPHTWIAAEYVLAVACLFAYERDSDHSLVLAAGVAAEWIDGAGVQVTAMPTRYGRLTYSLRRIDVNTVCFTLAGEVAATIELRPPLPGPLRSVSINGRPSTDFRADSVTISAAPAEVICVTGTN